jgi:hypothetical protein
MSVTQVMHLVNPVVCGLPDWVQERTTKRRRVQSCDLLFTCFPFLPKPEMVDPERPHARRVQAGADRELGRSTFNHPTGAGATRRS